MDINIPEICGEDIISRGAGRKIRDLILANWDEKIIRILVSGKLIASVSFFDEAVGLLMKKGGKSYSEVLAKLQFPDLSVGDRQLLNSIVRARIDELKASGVMSPTMKK